MFAYANEHGSSQSKVQSVVVFRRLDFVALFVAAAPRVGSAAAVLASGTRHAAISSASSTETMDIWPVVNAQATRRPSGDILARLQVEGSSSVNKRVFVEVSTTVRVDATTNAPREEEDREENASSEEEEEEEESILVIFFIDFVSFLEGAKKSTLLNRP